PIRLRFYELTRAPRLDTCVTNPLRTDCSSNSSVSISFGSKQCRCNFAPLWHWQRLWVRWEDLNADVVRARGLMRANPIDNSIHITPGDDGVHQAVTARAHKILVTEPEPP